VPDSQRAWARYLDGLTTVYESWGVASIVDRPRLEREGCQLFWLLRERNGACVGGIRVEGPHPSAGAYAGLAEMGQSPDAGRLTAEVAAVLDAGLVEFKGAWNAQCGRGYGAVLGRCMQHSLWWLGVPNAFCVSAAHAEGGWISSGARRLDSIAPAPYPDDRYRSVVLWWDGDHTQRIAPHQQTLIRGERRYLLSARARFGPSDAPSVPGEDVSPIDHWQRWHPELLFDFDGRVSQLMRAGVDVVDTTGRCRAELGRLLPAAGPELIDEPSHWVHLPWRNLLLHLPGPETYWRLRTDRSRHKLLDTELQELRQRSVGVVGLSVGSAAAFVLAQEGLCGYLRIADHDTLELTNLNRLPGSVADLGSAKTWILARRLAELDPYLPVTLYDEGVTHDNIDAFLAGLDAVVEECDSMDVKLLVRQRARRLGIPVVMETSDRGLLDVERFDREPHRPVFHGHVGDLDPEQLAGLTTDEKVPHVLGILEPEELSAPMAASMVEIDHTTRTWPQLASDVALGSSLVAATVRRLFTRPDQLRSGRTRLDLDRLLDRLGGQASVATSHDEPVEPAPTERPPLSTCFDQALIEAAGLAPSGGNMQPWRFELNASSFGVVIEPQSQVGMDVAYRGSAVACGAALANALAVAAAHARLRSSDRHLDLALDLDRPQLAGRILLGSATNQEWAGLAPHIIARVTNRHYGPPLALCPEMVELLTAATTAGGGRLCYVPPARLGSLTETWAEADRIRLLTPRLHQEMMSELRRPGVDPLTEGIDERSLELSPSDVAKLPILRRADVMAQLERWDGGYRLGDDTRKRLQSSSGLLVVVVDGASRADYVRGGVALQRMWLTAARLGLGLHPMSPLFGYAHTEEELAEMVRPDRAEALLQRGRQAFRDIGIEPGESFVLACRVLVAPPSPSAISQRRPAREAPVAPEAPTLVAPADRSLLQRS
jgi:hypothetical protein